MAKMAYRWGDFPPDQYIKVVLEHYGISPNDVASYSIRRGAGDLPIVSLDLFVPAIVGESGRELVDLAPGARITPPEENKE